MNTGNKQILYVAAQPGRDSRFESELANLKAGWDVSISASANEALALIGKRNFDAIIANDQLADMDGFRLLDEIQQSHPHTRRFVVADFANPETAVRSSGIAHQCLPKPLDSEMLRTSLERTFSLNIWLSNPKVRELLTRMKTVPSPPDLYFAIAQALSNPETNLEEVSTRAAQDPAMSAKLLQVANSAALGLRHKVINIEEAIGYLGLETTRSLVLLAHTFSCCGKDRTAVLNIDRLWKHSLNTGTLARRIAREEGASRTLVDEAFLAGLLHDIGVLLFVVNLPGEYKEALHLKREKNIPLWQSETELFGVSHSELGAELMAIWNLPLSVVETLALHHHPSKLISAGFGPLVAVHVADVIEHELARSPDDIEGSYLEMNYLADIGVTEQLESWRTACEQELRSDKN